MSSYVTRKTPGNTDWFVADRFGMFIHWGLYSMPARHEWIKTREKISEEKYDKYFKYFNPDMFDAKEWAKQAKNAGMRAVSVLWGYRSRAQLEEAGAKVFAEDFSELLRIL